MSHRSGILQTCLLGSLALAVTVLGVTFSKDGGSAPDATSAGPSRPDVAGIWERSAFQTQASWDPMLHVRSDVAICYGINATLPRRISQWKAQGYVPHAMMGVSWGDYREYLLGRFDGRKHADEAQVAADTAVISHPGGHPYMVPSESYGKYLALAKRAIDAGAEAIHLEEPEFWARAGYEEPLKHEWKTFFGQDWVLPNRSPDAQYRASLLKYSLYGRLLEQVIRFVKAEGSRVGRRVRCYVGSHSLLNYAALEECQPGIEPDPGRSRRCDSPGFDGFGPHSQPL